MNLKKVRVVGYRDVVSGNVINTTSKSKTWSQGLSPFYVGPVEIYGGNTARNVENAWQYSKLYPEYADSDGNPTENYFEWAKKGWNSSYADRYPMGKGKIPLCSVWDDEKIGYVEARKRIYLPLYAKAVSKTLAFKQLQKEYSFHDEIILLDFDGYDHQKLGMSFDDVMNDAKRKMGHAFVLAMLLEGKVVVDGNDIIIN